MALLAIKADETQLGPCPSLSSNGAVSLNVFPIHSQRALPR